MGEAVYKIVVTAPARLPSARNRPGIATVAADGDSAVDERLAEELSTAPRRVGTPMLAEPLIAFWSVRRGKWRVLYEINESDREVIVHRIERRPVLPERAGPLFSN